jgi:hypothetical protein
MHLCGAVLNLEITAIVQNPLCLSFHQKQKKETDGISKKGLKNGLDTTVIFTSRTVHKNAKQEPSWQHRPWQRVA